LSELRIQIQIHLNFRTIPTSIQKNSEKKKEKKKKEKGKPGQPAKPRQPAAQLPLLPPAWAGNRPTSAAAPPSPPTAVTPWFSKDKPEQIHMCARI